MALPKIDVPTYEIELPISKIKIKYRPFLVKEQKNLLMALESNESQSIQQNVYDILYNCTLTEGIDINKLPIIDVEYYFINLRGKSVGEVVESRYRCNNEVDGKTCNNIMEQEINLLDIKVEQNDIPSEIQITDKISVKMKYPEFNVVKDSLKYDNISVAMADQKIENAIATEAEYIVSTDMSCLMQLNGVIQKKGLPLQTLHLADVLASGW